VGAGAIESIVAERNKDGDFKSIEELCRRCDLRGINKRVMESLIKAGALDSLGNRGTLLNNVNFDLWGEEVPAPMPSLELAEVEIPVKETLAWERELMGVYLSEHPFSLVADKVASENTTLCGQLDAEMAGKSVVVAGMVAMAYHLFTRERQPFVRAILEDLDGSVEVMVWPNVYADTMDLWQEGNILLVEGKVRIRDDKVQLNCDRVRRYQPEATPAGEVAVEEPVEVPVEAEERPVQEAPEERHHLIISLNQTSDRDRDEDYLRQVISTIKEFPGHDEARLCINGQGSPIILKLPNTKYCPELHQRLVELVGEEGLRLEAKERA